MTTIAASASHVDATHVPWPAIAFGALAASGTVPAVGILWSVAFLLLMKPISLLSAPFVVVVATIVVVITWLAGEFRVYSRLRIPVFDPPDEM